MLSFEQIDVLEVDWNLGRFGRHPCCSGRGAEAVDVQRGYPTPLHSGAAGPITHLLKNSPAFIPETLRYRF